MGAALKFPILSEAEMYEGIEKDKKTERQKDRQSGETVRWKDRQSAETVRWKRREIITVRGQSYVSRLPKY